jgi:DNA-binding transcriptional LysR family regulator
MELRHLRYFVAVAETQNISRAAAKLNVSQPPLSRQIRDLEEELGVPLLERGAKSVRLTEAGRVFLTEAQAVLQRAAEAMMAVKAAAAGCTGEIHVGFAPSLTVEILPLVLRQFQIAHPGVKVALHDLSSEELLHGLRERKLSIALTVSDPQQRLRGLQFIPLRKYAVCVALSPAHPLALGKHVRLGQAAGERLIAYSRGEYPEYHEWLDTLFAGQKVRPQVSEEHASVTSLIAAIEAGRGIAIVPECLSCLAGPRLTLKPLHPAPAPLHVGILHRREKLTAQEMSFIAAAQ